jgi:saccharopine dehydrogenase-like NADP-dependent oxidoreductase
VCGGIPAPESNDNPFGYKISWSPRGVALAGTRPARWLENGTVAERGPGEIFRDPGSMPVDGLGTLETYPNGNSLPYAAKYGLDGAPTIFRGTFRWPGWCATWRAIARLGWLDDAAPADALRPEDAARTLALAPDDAIVERLRWLGLFDDGPAAAAARSGRSRLDHLVTLMEARMVYRGGEHDLVVLIDEVTLEGATPRTLAATIVERGDADGETAMAKLVGVPAALVACRMLDGSIAGGGVRIPVDPKLVRTLLADLAGAGITARFSERTSAA